MVCDYMHPGLHLSQCDKSFTHPTEHIVAVLVLQDVHHASLSSSYVAAPSKIRAHWARPIQCSDADTLDDSADIFDEDAPLLSGVQLTESLQRKAHTSAYEHGQICREAAQVTSPLQLILVSIYTCQRTALLCLIDPSSM